MDKDEVIAQMLQNTMRTIKIIGLYGVSGYNLVEPTDPDCDLVIVVRGTWGRLLYFIDGDRFSQVGRDDKIPMMQHWTTEQKESLDEYREEIQKYLDVGEIVVAKDRRFGPIIRHAYPKIMAQQLVSVQPLNTPEGLGKVFLSHQAPSDTPERSEGQEKPQEGPGDAKKKPS